MEAQNPVEEQGIVTPVSYPNEITKIRLESSSKCQLQCPNCPTGAGLGKERLVGWGSLLFEDFKKLIDQNPGIRQVELSNWGEMFLNKDILKIIEYAYHSNVKLSAMNGTNFNSVPEKTAEGLVKYQFERMRLSIDGTNQETYSRFRRNGNFDRVMRNIDTVNKYKKEYGSIYPQMTWVFIAFSYNQHEIPLAAKMAEERGMNFIVSPNMDPTYYPIDPNAKPSDQQSDDPAVTTPEEAVVTDALQGVEQIATGVDEVPVEPKPLAQSEAPVDDVVPDGHDVNTVQPSADKGETHTESPEHQPSGHSESAESSADATEEPKQVPGPDVIQDKDDFVVRYAPCYQLWREPQINFDGKLLGCCHNTNYGHFGNVFETSLKDCMESEVYQYTQRMLLGEAPPDDQSPCTKCAIYHHMKDRDLFNVLHEKLEV